MHENNLLDPKILISHDKIERRDIVEFLYNNKSSNGHHASLLEIYVRLVPVCSHCKIRTTTILIYIKYTAYQKKNCFNPIEDMH
jgi:hypothetical protein